MKSTTLLIIITLALTACGGESSSKNISNKSVSLALNKAAVDYFAYKISDQDWVEINSKANITINSQQTLTLASICIDDDSESYSSQAEIHNFKSLTDNKIAIYEPQCNFFSGQSVEGNNVTITSQQEKIAIGAISTPSIINVQSLKQDFILTVPNEGPFGIAVVGISQEKEIYIYKSLNIMTSESENIIIDFYNELSAKVTEFQEIPLNNWDNIESLYEVDSLLISLFNSWKSDSESSTSKQFISIPEVLKKESGRYLSFPLKITGIKGYILEARISNTSSPKIEALPIDLSSLNNINIDYSENNERYTLSIKSDISSIIPLPTNSFTIEKSSSHRFDPFNPSPPYWDKKQITTNYIVTKDNTLVLTPIEFHLLPGSPIYELTDNEITSISSNIYFVDRKVDNDKVDYYKLSRNLNEFIAK